jgi:6-phosphofructokinase 2
MEEKAIDQLIDFIRTFTPTYVVASGSLPPGLPAHFYRNIVHASNQIGAKCIVDTSGPALQALKNSKAFLLKPNIGELSKMLEVDTLQKKDVPEAAQQAIRDGYANMLAVSMGAEGAWLVTEKEQYLCKAPEVERKSTVGAGDSMVAGIAYMMEKGHSLEEVIQFGVACGSAATMNEGTQLFKIEDVQRLFEQLQKGN